MERWRDTEKYYDYEGESSDRANAQKYEGEFENNLQHGTGKQVWKDGSSYEGEWKYGKKEGEGYFEWKDGSWYRVSNQKSLFLMKRMRFRFKRL